MKLLLLSDANSVHTWKWVESLIHFNINIKVFSLFKPNKDMHKLYKAKKVKVGFEYSSDQNGKFLSIKEIKKIISTQKFKNL